MSEWGEDRMLPSVLSPSDVVSEPETQLSTTTQELEEVPSDLQASTLGLNAYATEFLPTLTMQVPLMGIYDVIVEGDEAQEEVQHPERSDALRFVSPHCMTPLQNWQCPSGGSKAGKSSSGKFWRKPKPTVEVRQPRVLQGVPADASISEEQLARRMRSIRIGMDTKEYQFHVDKVRAGRPGAGPEMPDPNNSSIGRRQWNHAVQNWRDELRRLYLLETEGLSLESQPEAASVASTEAEESLQASELDDSITACSDDASSSHWS